MEKLQLLHKRTKTSSKYCPAVSLMGRGLLICEDCVSGEENSLGLYKGYTIESPLDQLKTFIYIDNVAFENFRLMTKINGKKKDDGPVCQRCSQK